MIAGGHGVVVPVTATLQSYQPREKMVALIKFMCTFGD